MQILPHSSTLKTNYLQCAFCCYVQLNTALLNMLSSYSTLVEIWEITGTLAPDVAMFLKSNGWWISCVHYGEKEFSLISLGVTHREDGMVCFKTCEITAMYIKSSPLALSQTSKLAATGINVLYSLKRQHTFAID